MSDSESKSPDDADREQVVVRGRIVKGRVVYSRGPIVWALESLTVLSAVLAIAAMIYTVVETRKQFTRIQDARQRTAFDTCQILTVLLRASVSTPVGQTFYVVNLHGRRIGKVATQKVNAKVANREAHVFLKKSGLANCAAYAYKVRHGIATITAPAKPLIRAVEPNPDRRSNP